MDKKLIELKNLVEAAEISLQQARAVLVELVGSEEEKMISSQARRGTMSSSEEGQVIEGVFDGQNMVGPDEKKYSVPANYASKSKLVEGDSLKLTITPDGSFVYKQIKLLDRDRIVGDLIIDEATNEYRVLANSKSYKVLSASVTYYRGEAGDKATILVPKGRESSWAAVENIFKPGHEPAPIVETKPAEEAPKQEGGEFLTQEDKPAEEKPMEEKPIEDKPAEDKPAGEPVDILAAASKVDTDDVKPVTEAEASVADTGQGSMSDDLNQAKDNQGLEEI